MKLASNGDVLKGGLQVLHVHVLLVAPLDAGQKLSRNLCKVPEMCRIEAADKRYYTRLERTVPRKETPVERINRPYCADGAKKRPARGRRKRIKDWPDEARAKHDPCTDGNLLRRAYARVSGCQD